MFKHEIFKSELSEPKQKLTVRLEDGTEIEPTIVTPYCLRAVGYNWTFKFAGIAVKYRIGESEWRDYDRAMFAFKFE